MEDYLPLPEAAAKAGLKRNTLVHRIRRGTVKAKKFGWVWMIPLSEVERIKPVQRRTSK